MTHLTRVIEEGELVGEYLRSRVGNVVAEVLLPKVIDRRVIESYIRRALRNRSWFKLTRFQRALLKASSKVVEVVKSPVLADVLKKVFLEIELHSLKGRALYFGLLIALSMGESLSNLLSRLTYVMMLGINYLSTPLLYRVYG